MKNKDTKIVKIICVIVGVISMFIVIGLIGGLENDAISMLDFIQAQFITWFIFAMSVIGWYKMEQIEDKRERKNF